MTTRYYRNRRNPRPPGLLLFLTVALCGRVAAQSGTPVPLPAPQQTAPTPNVPQIPPTNAPNAKLPQTAPTPNTQNPTSPPAPIPGTTPTGVLGYEITLGGNISIDPVTGNISATGPITITGDGVTITADRLEGNFNRQLVLTGNARIVTNGVTSQADAIRFFPAQRSFRLDNPRAVLEPSFLRNQVTDPVFLRGGTLAGLSSGYGQADNTDATTCIEPRPHYDLRVGSAELVPLKRLVMRRIGIYFFGQKLVVVPEIVIPLDPRPKSRPRTDYLPEFGRNQIEGYFARFPYTFAVGAAAAAFLRLDLTQRHGVGYRVEQEYLAGKQDSLFNTGSSTNAVGSGLNFSEITSGSGTFASAYGYGSSGSLPRLGIGLGPDSGGLFAAQGYAGDGLNRNFTASFRHQQGIGSGNRLGLSTELAKNSDFGISGQTSQNTRFSFAHTDPAHGVLIDSSISYNTNDASTYSTSQLTGNLRQSYDFDSRGGTRNNVTVNFDLSRSLTDASGTVNRSASLNSQAQFQHASRDYSFLIQGNKTTPVGFQSDHSAFGTLERLPEIQFSSDSINFKGGWLKQLPTRFDVGFGQYSEPGSNTNTNRVLLGLTLQEQDIVRGRTEIATGGGFEQRLYGDGAAQYIIRETTRLRQRLGGRSGFDLNYQYQQPEGGTPFLFDTFPRSHYITAEGGYLTDSKFQATARVGYDFLGSSAGHPWQTLSTRMLYRPTPRTRFDALATFDPNTGKFFSASAEMRLRGSRDFAIDLLARYDPTSGKFAQVNTQFDVPVGRSWRMSGLLRYNGQSGRLESTNLQVVKRWDCMEASLTYTATPYGIQNQSQFYFAIRLTAFPFFRSFARGGAGEALGTGLGDLY